jgi:hypothetical protein
MHQYSSTRSTMATAGTDSILRTLLYASNLLVSCTGADTAWQNAIDTTQKFPNQTYVYSGVHSVLRTPYIHTI